VNFQLRYYDINGEIYVSKTYVSDIKGIEKLIIQKGQEYIEKSALRKDITFFIFRHY